MLTRAKNERLEEKIKRRKYHFNQAIVPHGAERKLAAKNKEKITDFS